MSIVRFLSLMLCSFTALGSVSNKLVSLPTLPKGIIAERFQKLNGHLEERANLFLKGKPFQKWSYQKPKEAIVTEFSQMNEWRGQTWYTDIKSTPLISRQEFMVAQDLLEMRFFRAPQTIAFEYNKAEGSYNASLIELNSVRFVAMESPTVTTLRNFLLLLQNYRVTQLIRIEHPLDVQKTNNPRYWVGLLRHSPKTARSILALQFTPGAPTYSIPYYSISQWQEDKDVSVDKLYDLIKQVRQQYTAEGLIACHSTHGAGRTGTFIAGFVLLTEIDKQIAAGVSKKDLDLSIEKVVMQLGLQRAFMVRSIEQYTLLYRLVDKYVDLLPK